jgi:uncharacterized protein (DUF1697 family)
MRGTQYLALLRGINVGGENLIRMAALKACFETCRVANVATHIQSGNVLFYSSESDAAALIRQLERTLSTTFRPYQARLVICSHAQLRKIVEKAPSGFGSRPAEYRYDVIFLRPSATVAEAMKQVSTKPGVDAAFPGPGVLYFSRLITKATQSRMGRIVGQPIYQDLTIRNWNTTSKLLALMDARAAPGRMV